MRKIRIESIFFKVSSSSIAENGYQSSLYIRGCTSRNGSADSFTACPMAGYIWLNGLYKSQSAHISPNAWRALVETARFEIDDLMPVELTAEMKEAILHSAIDQTIEAAEKQRIDANKHRAKHGKPLLEEDVYFQQHLFMIEMGGRK